MILATTNFTDIFKSNFLEQSSSVAYGDLIIAMALAIVIGLLIRYVYKFTYAGVMYSSSFGLSLVALTMIATFVILAVTSNIVLSLGMVGALSIVRFRSAIKEPIEIAYLFWAIASGIVIGAGLIFLAVLGCIFIAVVLIIFSCLKGKGQVPYIFVVHCANAAAEEKVMKAIGESVAKKVVKSKSVSKMGIELTLEVRLKADATEFVNKIADMDDVANAVLVSYNGEYMS
ncbi:MAG: DUF4956 domain-containing protein [Lachnospiraceae bacterium]|nr:DUF4956 domain-containing protein [Lachnospiraceae bacterium]